ncbi:unnamed protein product [Effrenium voratum]|nr:unnamed protein product [Effrenium voratum]
MLDSLSWATGKIFQYEALLIAEDIGWCYLITSLVITTAEILVEFLASACTPWLCRRLLRVEPSARPLARLAAWAYAFSNLLALLVYPVLGGLIFANITGPAMVFVMVTFRTLQYSFCNQVGDQALEMSRPDWLHTFKKTTLRMPGLGPCCVQRPASPEGLAYFVTFLRFSVMLALGGAYVAVKDSDVFRWALATTCLVVNFVVSAMLLWNLPALSAGIGDSSETGIAAESEALPKAGAAAGGASGFRGLCQLGAAERGYLAFVVVTYGVPPQALDALQSVLLLELPLIFQGLLIGASAFLILLSLFLKMRSLPETSEEAVAASSKPWQRFYRGWLLPLIGIVTLLAVGVSLSVWIGGSALYAAMLIFLPIGPLNKFIHARVDTFLLCYAGRGSDLVFWQNVLQVLVNLPLLLANCLAAEAAGCGKEDQSAAELQAATAVILVGVGALALPCLYFLAVEPFRRPSHRLCHLVDESLGWHEE